MKLKINWGYGIVIAFIAFISFILYFVVKVQSDSKYDNELVVSEYYKKDTRYGEEMAKMQAAADLAQKPAIDSKTDGVTITFPSTYNPEMTGKVSFYRPSASTLDFEIPISSSKVMLIPTSRLVGGQWDITIEWKMDGKEFMIKQNLYI